MHKFNRNIPENCPPSVAKPVERLIYRGIKSPPISSNDFLSHRELGEKCSAKGRYGECDCWSLSVWVSEEAVNHARGISGRIKQWYIAAGKVSKTDGVLMATPSNSQPEHHSFFCDINSDLAPKFALVMNPVTQ